MHLSAAQLRQDVLALVTRAERAAADAIHPSDLELAGLIVPMLKSRAATLEATEDGPWLTWIAEDLNDLRREVEWLEAVVAGAIERLTLKHTAERDVRFSGQTCVRTRRSALHREPTPRPTRRTCPILSNAPPTRPVRFLGPATRRSLAI